jgi:hypothetical protein
VPQTKAVWSLHSLTLHRLPTLLMRQPVDGAFNKTPPEGLE